ncbi:MAG TPA: alpha/beta hydrolase-fold protein [Streptosporangiaceae bacterium]|nr:alpha/beta hydrolase-fold protein [Streptosporangiaceae bacterium]
MLEPQSTVLFILLMAVFCALLVWVALAKEPVFRVFAASLAFVPAMLFGVAAVNKYYDYYRTWSSLAADLGGGGVASAAQVTGKATQQRVAKVLGQQVKVSNALTQGETARLTITGPVSHIARTVYVFLPPQYFQPKYAKYHFPVIELIPGFPGEPQDWINVVGITDTYLTLLNDGVVQPAVLVMPDANGGPQVSLQCLNVVHGPQDATFLADDIPHELAGLIRVQPAGQAWGIAGYSEGGYCAANLALVYPGRFGYAAVLSGYFKPYPDQIGTPPHIINPFRGSLSLEKKNTPMDRVRALPLALPLPRFWLGAGSANRNDVRNAEAFQRLLLVRQPNVSLSIARGGGHNMTTWRALVPPMLEWLTPRLSEAALHPAPAGKASPAPSPSSGTRRGTPKPHQRASASPKAGLRYPASHRRVV